MLSRKYIFVGGNKTNRSIIVKQRFVTFVLRGVGCCYGLGLQSQDKRGPCTHWWRLQREQAVLRGPGQRTGVLVRQVVTARHVRHPLLRRPVETVDNMYVLNKCCRHPSLAKPFLYSYFCSQYNRKLNIFVLRVMVNSVLITNIILISLSSQDSIYFVLFVLTFENFLRKQTTYFADF